MSYGFDMYDEDPERSLFERLLKKQQDEAAAPDIADEEQQAEARAAEQRARAVEPVTDEFNKKPAAPEIEPLDRRYDEWLKKMPRRDDPKYKPSLGRKILGSVVGGLVGLGTGKVNDIGSKIAEHDFNEATEDWEKEGKALGEVRPLEQSRLMGERWSERNRTTERGQDIRERTATADRAQKSRAAADRYETENARIDAMTDETERRRARDANDARYDQEMTAIHRREATVAERNATTNEGRLALAKTRYEHEQHFVPPGAQKTAGEMAVWALAAQPEYQEFIDPKTGAFKEPDPNDAAKVEIYNRMVRDYDGRVYSILHREK